MTGCACLCVQSLRESLRHEEAVKHDKHIFSFAIYEMAMINIGKREVS